MSYILDALRRADAERERGAVPGLHSQPAAPAPAAATPAPRRGPWIAAGAAAALAAIGAGAWWSTQRPAAPAAPAAPVAQAAPVPAATPAAPPTARLDTPPAAAPTAPASAETVPRVGPPRIVPPPAATTEAPRRVAPPAPAPVVAPARVAATAPGADRVIPIDQLSAEQRRGLPQLTIGGAIYSDQPAARMLLVGGQLLHEGDAAAPGVTLERIGPRSAVLRWRELRYEVPY